MPANKTFWLYEVSWKECNKTANFDHPTFYFIIAMLTWGEKIDTQKGSGGYFGAGYGVPIPATAAEEIKGDLAEYTPLAMLMLPD